MSEAMQEVAEALHGVHIEAVQRGYAENCTLKAADCWWCQAGAQAVAVLEIPLVGSVRGEVSFDIPEEQFHRELVDRLTGPLTGKPGPDDWPNPHWAP